MPNGSQMNCPFGGDKNSGLDGLKEYLRIKNTCGTCVPGFSVIAIDGPGHVRIILQPRSPAAQPQGSFQTRKKALRRSFAPAARNTVQPFFPRHVRGKTLSAKRVWDCALQAHGRGAERSESLYKKRRSHFPDTLQGALRHSRRAPFLPMLWGGPPLFGRNFLDAE